MRTDREIATPRQLLAIDPGPDESGWAILAPPGLRGSQARVRYVACGHDITEDVMKILLAHDGPVALEKTFWVPKFMNGQALMDTTRVEGEMRGICRVRGLVLHSLTSTEWRRALGLIRIEKGKMDRAVTHAVNLFVDGAPAGFHELNNHKRDAIGLGAAASRLLGKEWR